MNESLDLRENIRWYTVKGRNTDDCHLAVAFHSKLCSWCRFSLMCAAASQVLSRPVSRHMRGCRPARSRKRREPCSLQWCFCADFPVFPGKLFAPKSETSRLWKKERVGKKKTTKAFSVGRDTEHFPLLRCCLNKPLSIFESLPTPLFQTCRRALTMHNCTIIVSRI